MPTPTRKGIFLVLLAIFLVVAVVVIPDIISEEMRAWCLSTFGEGYQGYLLGFFLIGSVILLFLTTDIGQHLRPGAGNKSADLPPGTPDPDLVAKIRKYLTKRYDHRLNQKLAGRQPVNLRILPSKTGTSKEGAENYITLQENEVRAAIGDIFTRANNRLLLVGLPGAGKTTLVLQLALHLLERPGSSMPVVLNLATWRAEFKTFEEWLKKILPTELGASTGLAEQIRNHTPLILLLDGLDEVRRADRDSLLAGIGEYGADANRQFLISSRIAEYAATKDAPVNAQVEVAPLTVEQVEMGLAATANIQPESRRLLNALKSDPMLREAVENPFYLNTAQLLFSTGKNWSELGFTATDVAGRQRELVERFVEGALERNVSHEYPPDKAGHWLSFLASRMTERNMVVFELRDLQYDWWRWGKWQLIVGRRVAGLVDGLSMGLSFGLIMGLVIGMFGGIIIEQRIYIFNGLFGGLLLGLLFGLFIWLLNGLFTGIFGDLNKIQTKDKVNYSWNNFFIGIKNRLFVLLLIWSITWIVFGLTGEPTARRVFILAIGLAFGLYAGLEGILKSNTHIVQIATPYQRFKASMKKLYFSILQHLFLRYQLFKQGLFPLHLVTFLNEVSLRHILEFDGNAETSTGGGSWRFRHRILQEYFTAKYVVDNGYPEIEKLVQEHLYDSKWKEVFLLVACTLHNADELLLLILRKNRDLLNDPDLTILFQCVEQLLFKPEKSVFLNFCRLYVILRMFEREEIGITYEEAIELSKQDKRTKEEYDIDFYHVIMEEEFIRLVSENLNYLVDHFKSALITGEGASIEVDIYKAKQLEQSITWKNPKLQAPQNFFEANLLMMRIINSAAYLSKSTREYVLSMMLAPLEEETEPK